MSSPSSADRAIVVVFASVRAVPGRGDELAEELAATAATRSAEPGNLAFIVARSHSDPGEFRFCEIYADAAAHAEHRRLARLPGDPHAARLARLVAAPVTVVTGSLVYGPPGIEPVTVDLATPPATVQ